MYLAGILIGFSFLVLIVTIIFLVFRTRILEDIIALQSRQIIILKKKRTESESGLSQLVFYNFREKERLKKHFENGLNTIRDHLAMVEDHIGIIDTDENPDKFHQYSLKEVNRNIARMDEIIEDIRESQGHCLIRKGFGNGLLELMRIHNMSRDTKYNISISTGLKLPDRLSQILFRIVDDFCIQLKNYHFSEEIENVKIKIFSNKNCIYINFVYDGKPLTEDFKKDFFNLKILETRELLKFINGSIELKPNRIDILVNRAA